MFTLPPQTKRDGALVGDACRDAGPAGRLRMRSAGANWAMTTFATSEHTSPAHFARPLGAPT